MYLVSYAHCRFYFTHFVKESILRNDIAMPLRIRSVDSVHYAYGTACGRLSWAPNWVSCGAVIRGSLEWGMGTR